MGAPSRGHDQRGGEQGVEPLVDGRAGQAGLLHDVGAGEARLGPEQASTSPRPGRGRAGGSAGGVVDEATVEVMDPTIMRMSQCESADFCLTAVITGSNQRTTPPSAGPIERSSRGCSAAHDPALLAPPPRHRRRPRPGRLRSGDTAATGTRAGGTKVAAVIKGLDNPFFQSMEQGIEDQAKAAGATVTVQAANSITDTTGQADKLTGLAGQDYSCYIVNPISGTNLVQGIAQLAAKKKTIVNIDSPVDAGRRRPPTPHRPPTSAPTTSGRGEGRRADGHPAAGGGKVAAIGGIAGDVTSGARIDGFTKGIRHGRTSCRPSPPTGSARRR